MTKEIKSFSGTDFWTAQEITETGVYGKLYSGNNLIAEHVISLTEPIKESMQYLFFRENEVELLINLLELMSDNKLLQ